MQKASLSKNIGLSLSLTAAAVGVTGCDNRKSEPPKYIEVASTTDEAVPHLAASYLAYKEAIELDDRVIRDIATREATRPGYLPGQGLDKNTYEKVYAFYKDGKGIIEGLANKAASKETAYQEAVTRHDHASPYQKENTLKESERLLKELTAKWIAIYKSEFEKLKAKGGKIEIEYIVAVSLDYDWKEKVFKMAGRIADQSISIKMTPEEAETFDKIIRTAKERDQQTGKAIKEIAQRNSSWRRHIQASEALPTRSNLACSALITEEEKRSAIDYLVRMKSIGPFNGMGVHNLRRELSYTYNYNFERNLYAGLSFRPVSVEILSCEGEVVGTLGGEYISEFRGNPFVWHTPKPTGAAPH